METLQRVMMYRMHATLRGSFATDSAHEYSRRVRHNLHSRFVVHRLGRADAPSLRLLLPTPNGSFRRPSGCKSIYPYLSICLVSARATASPANGPTLGHSGPYWRADLSRRVSCSVQFSSVLFYIRGRPRTCEPPRARALREVERVVGVGQWMERDGQAASLCGRGGTGADSGAVSARPSGRSGASERLAEWRARPRVQPVQPVAVTMSGCEVARASAH